MVISCQVSVRQNKSVCLRPNTTPRFAGVILFSELDRWILPTLNQSMEPGLMCRSEGVLTYADEASTFAEWHSAALASNAAGLQVSIRERHFPLCLCREGGDQRGLHISRRAMQNLLGRLQKSWWNSNVYRGLGRLRK